MVALEPTLLITQVTIYNEKAYFHFRYMVWMIQSRIVPPFFYLIISENEKLKFLKHCLCLKKQNTVHPIVQSETTLTITVGK